MTSARLGDKTLFSSIARWTYLNHAAISPPSAAVLAAARFALEDYAARGSSAFVTWIEQRARLREKLATLVGARADEIALGANTTRGLTDLALSIPWRAKDRVICFEGEFPANVTPWQRAAELFDLEVVLLPLDDLARPGGADLGRLEAELREGARLVAISAVEFQTGLRTPLAAIGELAHARGAEVAVDGVQAIGATPVDVRAEGVDYLACGGHKWLMSGPGVGFVFARRELHARLRPNVAGWMSHEDAFAFLLRGPELLRYDRPIPRAMTIFEGANLNDAGLAGLEASVDALLELGVANIHAHVNALLDPIERAFVELGFTSERAPDAARRSCVLGLRPPEGRDVIAIARALAERNVVVSTPDGRLRVSPHWPNDARDAERLIEVARSVLARR